MRSRFSRLLSLFSVALVSSAMLVVTFDAEAKRLGGGRDSGRQSSNVTQRQATPPQQTATQTPAQPAAAPAAAGAATAGAAAKSGASRWLGPIAGIAAGLGIAALLTHLGLGAALAEFIGSMLLIALLVFAGLFIWRMMRRGNSPQPAAAGAGAGGFARVSMPSSMPGSATGATSPAAPAASGLPAGESTVASSATWTIPAGFDVQAFLQGAKTHFVSMQKAWDQGDVDALREFMTDDMLAETRQQLAGREGENVTEIVLLNAELLGIEDVGDGHLASVRFSGMLREARGAESERFEEVWNLYKARQGGGWLLAGIQQLN